MPISHISVLHKNLARRVVSDVLEKRADPADCSNIYISPTMGQTVNALDPLPITWNSTCLSTQEIDIYLYSPGADLPRIHVWENVALSRGTYNATLMPRWWNSTASQNLQISIVPAGKPPFLSQFPGGPVFIATYTAPASGTPPSADTTVISSGITQVNDLANAKKALSPGKKAAAAILTILFVGLCIAAYIKWKRIKGKNARKRWTEAVDKRMSTISSDWKSVSAAGANAAIRNSIAVGNRSSSFSFGGIRPPSTLVEGTDEKRPMSQMRTGVGLRNPTPSITTERVSRVSFAPDTRVSRTSVADPRPSGESRRTRAFHTAYVPPVPALPTADPDEGSLSPRQSQGPLTLTPDDIRARINTSKRSLSISATPNHAGEFDEVMPALRMMRTGGDSSAPDDFLFKAPNPPPPVATYPMPINTSVPPAPQNTTSPVMSSMPMEPVPANVMSPDEMLRAYAERKKSMSPAPPVPPSPSITSISYPKAIIKKASMSLKSKPKRAGSNTMRVLYNANTGGLSSTNTNDDAYGGMASRQSVSPSESSTSEGHVVENMAGMGTAFGHTNGHPFAYHPNTSIEVDAYGGSHYAIGEEEVDVGVTGRSAEVGAYYNGHAV